MARLEDVLTLEWDYLLIERERPSGILAAGVSATGESYVIEAPDNSRKSGEARTGKIVLVGPEVPPFYAQGKRAVFSPLGGTKLKLVEGDDKPRELWLLSRREIFAVMDGEEGDDTLAADWLKHMLPPPGKLLVERVEAPPARGLLFIPDGVNLSARSNEAKVIAVGEGVTRFRVDERVYLADSIGKFIPVDHDKRRVYVADQAQVLGHLDDSGAGVVAEQHPLMGADTLPLEEIDRMDEGDQRLPQ